ncbi:MAG: YajQ family cyclic di-GMP-binding protein [Proteobacteria bacterium]|nr:YajQ family cyclic di-GMP-binding protein [Pseudomonadota bacterium]
MNKVELRNALDQTNKEVGNRFDFKGTDARIEQKELELTVYADSTFQLQQVMDVLRTKCAKRGVDMRSFEPEEPEKIGGDKMKQLVKVKEGIEQELGKKIVKAIKDAKLKVQASIQGNAVRVSGAKKDELQEAMALVRKTVSEVPVQFNNFRD